MIRLTRLSLEEEFRAGGEVNSTMAFRDYTAAVSIKGLYDTKKGMFIKLGEMIKINKKVS